MRYSKFVVDFVEILTEVEKIGEIPVQIHGVLSDACLIVTRCITNERWKAICFVTHAENSTMLRLERCQCLERALVAVFGPALLSRVAQFSAHVIFHFCNVLFMRVSNGRTFGDNRTSSDTSCSCFLCGSRSWWRCRFQGCDIKAWSGSLDTAFCVDEASVKEAVVACCALLPLCVCSVDVPSLFVAQGDLLTCAHCENTPSWHDQCVSCMVIVLYRDIAVVLIAAVAI